ncbi:MAG: aminotransferase class III-fold pyridoxal phosphate-dependent enzyme [Thermoanaerobaculia bacterium]|nr:aminotransferase class III-fold pyridoxal phosphate-dependent enzyme [Thermoanaerobaculia bacterium]
MNLPLDPDRAATAEWMARARRRLGWGPVATRLRPLEFYGQGLPQFARAVNGPWVTDTTGRKLVDWNLGGGSALLGWCRPEVDAAVRAQAQLGPLAPFPFPLEVEVAEALCRLVPSAEVVAYGKNGSDALTAAVRLARAATGRETVLFHGFHGFHDWYAATHPDIRGVPEALRSLTWPFPYNDLAALEALLEGHAGQVAAVVLEPTKTELPAPGYLAGVRSLTHRHCALLIFDEVVTAFRVARGGAQEAFGVLPDLTCLGKAMANGLPLSAVVGPREILELFPSIGVGMTYEGEAHALAAARAALAIHAAEPVAEHVARIGTEVQRAFDAAVVRHGLDARLTGHPSRLQIHFGAVGDFPPPYLLGLFLTAALARGVVTNGTMLGSAAHDEAAVAMTIDALEGALGDVAQTLTGGVFQGWELPGHEGIEGYVDRIEGLPDGSREVHGWLLGTGAPADSWSAVAVSGELSLLPEHRADLATAFPDRPHADGGGFALAVPPTVRTVEITARQGSRAWQFTLVFLGEAHPARDLPQTLAPGRVLVFGDDLAPARPRGSAPDAL